MTKQLAARTDYENQNGEEATIRLHEKGDKRRTIGLHFAAAQVIAEYIEHAGITMVPSSGRGSIRDRRSSQTDRWIRLRCIA
jgi:site-specific recombinase XerD